MANAGYMLMNVAKRMRYDLNESLAAVDLTAAQWAVLGQVSRSAGAKQVVSAADMTTMLGMDKPTVSAIVRRLVQKGLLERRPRPSDGRAFDLFLTDAGVKACLEAMRRSDAVLDDYIQLLTPQERQEFDTILTKLGGKAEK